MTKPLDPKDRLLDVRHRDLRLATTMVIATLAGGLALLWPAVQERVVARFGPFFPSRFLLGELLLLVALFLIHVWRKAGTIERLVADLLAARGRGAALEERLAQARAVLTASAQLQLDDDVIESLRSILRCMTEALQAKRSVLWRQRAEGRAPEREAVFPSSDVAPDPLHFAFEDEVARKVVATGAMLVIDESTDLRQIGIAAARPRGGPACHVAAPLVLDGKAVGAVLLCEPNLQAIGDESPLALLEVFSGFAAGVLRNLRIFQQIARRNGELLRARQLLCDHQRELAEIDAVSTMSRVAKSLAHGLSGPLTSIAGYVDVALTTPPEALTVQSAREGLRHEVAELKRRLQSVVEFTETWRREYGVADLNQIVETAVALQAEPLRARGIGCRFEPHAGLPFTVADATRLRQVFLSLLTFLRDAVAAGPSREVRVRTLAEAGMLRVQVDFAGRPDLARWCAPLLDPNVDVSMLQKEHHVELPVAVAIVREHRGNLEMHLREDGTTRITVELPVLDAAPDAVAATPAGEETFEQVLARICGDPPPPAPERAPAASAPRKAEPIVVAVAPPEAAREETPAAATHEPAAPAPAAAPKVAAPPAAEPKAAEPAPRAPRLVLPAPSGPANAGLEDLFSPGELFQGGTPRKAVMKPRSSEPRRSLLDEAEIEGTLSIFDQEEKPSSK